MSVEMPNGSRIERSPIPLSSRICGVLIVLCGKAKEHVSTRHTTHTPTYPADKITSRRAKTSYRFSPCWNSAPSASMPSSVCLRSKRVTIAPVSTLRLDLPITGWRYV